MTTRNLRLVFFHGRSTFNGKKIDIKLCSKYNVTIDNDKYTIELNPRYVYDFWYYGIEDIAMIVGNNGSGKSDICNTLIDFLCSTGSRSSDDSFLLCEVNNTLKVIIRENHKYTPVVIWKTKRLPCEIYSLSAKDSLLPLQCIYYKPCLDEYDYMRQSIYSNLYDVSVGGLIHKARSSQYDSKPTATSTVVDYRDDIVFYYSMELKEILIFFRDVKKFIDKDNSPNIDIVKTLLRYPQSLIIHVADYNNYLDFIANWKKYRLSDLPDVEPISKVIRRLRQNTTTESCIFNLILNIVIAPLYLACSKVVPTSVKLKKEYATFCNNFLLNLESAQLNSNDASALNEWALMFMKKLISVDTQHINPYIEEAIEALDSIKPAFDMCIKDNIYGNEALLNFSTLINENTADRKFDNLFHFIDQINKLELEYSFISYDFALSTGEIAVWKILCKLFNAVHNDTYTFNYVIFDEPDMALHPEWQRRIIYILDWFSSILFKKSKKGLQYLITTHSPILLSDMPMSNVVYLYPPKDNSYNICNNRNFNTLGNVIYSLYNDAFFLNENGQVGEHAKKWINGLIQELKSNDNSEDSRFFNEEQIAILEKKISIIGDPILQGQLLRMLYRRSKSNEQQMKLVDRKILETEKYLSYLRRIKIANDTDQI